MDPLWILLAATPTLLTATPTLLAATPILLAACQPSKDVAGINNASAASMLEVSDVSIRTAAADASSIKPVSVPTNLTPGGNGAGGNGEEGEGWHKRLMCGRRWLQLFS